MIKAILFFGLTVSTLHAMEPKPKTLYEYFNLPPASTIHRDIKKLIAKSIIGEGGWWCKYKDFTHSGSIDALKYNESGSRLALACGETFCVELDENLVDSSNVMTVIAITYHPSNNLRAISFVDSSVVIDKPHVNGEIPFMLEFPLSHYENLEINSIAFHPTNTLIAAVSQNKVYICNYGDKKFVTTLEIPDTVSKAMYHPATGILATASGHKVYLWDESHKQIATFLHEQHVKTMAFHPTKPLIAVASGAAVSLWEGTNKCVYTYEHKIPHVTLGEDEEEVENTVQDVTYSADGLLLATASEQLGIIFWNNQHQKIRRITGPFCGHAVAFHPNTNELATSFDCKIGSWKKHACPTLEQTLLRQLLKNWLITCIKGEIIPVKLCEVPEKMPSWIASTFNIQLDDLQNTWQSIPEDMRRNIYLTIKNNAEEITEYRRTINEQKERKDRLNIKFDGHAEKIWHH